MSEAAIKDVKRLRPGRSPAYPGISLKAAIAKAKELYDAEGKYAAPMTSAFKAWGYGEKSSGGREIRAALRYFGLITVEGDAGTVKLTEDALRVLLDGRDDQSENKTIIRRLALKPSVHAKLFEAYPEGIKSNATAEHFLVFTEGYSKGAAGDIVSEFKETAHYAGLFQPGDVPSTSPSKGKPQTEKTRIEVGDLIQIEIGGAFSLPNPERVRAVQEHNGHSWLFVENHEAGVLVEQAILVEKGASDVQSSVVPPTLPLKMATVNQLIAGEREWLKGPLSRNVTYRLIVTGDLGPKELGKLIKLLEAQKAVLSDDNEETELR